MATNKRDIHQRLDNHREHREREEFRLPLSRARSCRARLVAEKVLTQILRRVRPLYSAPDALREWLGRAGVSVLRKTTTKDRV
jgi:hypothetical protein